MVNFYDIAYSAALLVTAPVWLFMPRAREKVAKALRLRDGSVRVREGNAPAVMIHAVSLGEINATRGLVARLREMRPGLHCIISTTTDTGYERAMELYGRQPAEHVTIIRYPLDYSSAVRRVLDRLRPNAVVLLELELWPNFMTQCAKRAIPVILVNGRMTEPSFKRYRWGGAIVRKMFSRLSWACVQDEAIGRRFVALGAPPEKLSVTGTMKFDTAQPGARVEGDRDLAADLKLRPHALNSDDARAERVWVCGSTGPGEERILLQIYKQLLSRNTRLRIAIIPRKPERFDEVAGTISAAGFDLIRRSRPDEPFSITSLVPPVILGDTMGELRKFYSLADLVFVGRSLVDLGARQHGSDMIEPAALGKGVIVGPFTTNFADVMSKFRAAEAMLEVRDAAELAEAAGLLLSSPDQAVEMGKKARQVVIDGRGATERHAAVILQHLPAPAAASTLSSAQATFPGG